MKRKSSPDSKLDDALVREIHAIINVEPSREYAARLRRRIESEPALTAWRLGWLLPAIVATVAVLLVIAERPHSIHSDGTTTSIAASSESVGSSPALITARPDRSSASVVSRIPTPLKTRQREPELLIAAKESTALRRLWGDRMAEFPALSEPIRMKENIPDETTELKVAEIVIEPLAPSPPIQIEPIEPTALAKEGVE